MKTKRYSLAALALTLLALAACRQDDGLGTDNGSDGTLPVTLGQIAIGGSSTRLATANPDAWETGDLIRISAPGTNGNPVTATYKYNAAATADARWTQIDPASTDDPDAAHATGDTYPLYLESFGATGTDAPATTLETWGGSAGWSGSTDYLNQSTPDAYRLNDYLRCPAATRALAGTGASRTCQLSGTLSHQRVSLVLKVADGGTYSDRLPQDAVLRLYLTDGTTTSTLGRRLTAWREGKTDASGTPGSSGYVPATTTFRALVALEDVPGITATATVRPGSVLGEVTYTDGGTRQTQYITYSVKSAPAGSTDADGNALIAAGMRITVTATFKDAPSTPTPPPTPPTKPEEPDVTISGTATLTPWNDTDLGDVGTETPDIIETAEKGENNQPIYQVYTAEGLQAFADIVNGKGTDDGTKNLAANARLMTDIDLSSVCGESVNGGTSWVPIADGKYNSSSGYDNKYTGTFDGQGHTISGLYISSDRYQNAGLFGKIGNGGKVQNLRVKAVKVENQYGSNSYTGALAGCTSGTIINCEATGDVTGGSSIGGLVGYNDGTIIACYATGDVTGGSNVAGGLVGYNDGTIIACYATGDVTGGTDTGGFAGVNTNGTITACYTTGTASGGSIIGGFAGYNYAAAGITYCFWQKGTSNIPDVGTGYGDNVSGNILTPIDATGQITWETAMGKYEKDTGPSKGRTLNAAIFDWNNPSGQGHGTSDAKHCGYYFKENTEYKSAADKSGVPPLLLAPLEEPK